MGFGQGLSGLNASSQNLDVIGNNIANSGTVGFKSGSATFADVYASSRVGLGVQVASINQRFTTGIVSTSGNQFDMAIDGAKGLFVVTQPNGATLYTRNGQFLADKDNKIVNAQGQQLMGYAPGGTNLIGMTVPVGNIAPQATSTLSNTVNMDANAEVVDVATHPFNPDVDAESFSNMTPLTVYDSLGNEHRVEQYYAKRPVTVGPPEINNWDVYVKVDGVVVDPATGNSATAPYTPAHQLQFDTAGRLIPATATYTLNYNVPVVGGAAAQPVSIATNYGSSTQFGGGFSQNFVQNGYGTGEYASMSIGSNGELIANYTNGAKQTMGTLALADFANLQGLQPVGGNAWAETANSGQPIVGTPGSNGLATIKGQAIEESNVDMSQELVNMIIAQRTYQANAQTIKTQDQILQTLITMR
ncbi:flagellar hook protein FlgE [Castellaniella sp. FW104-16D08]|uniref:flagellar hook protein FlgE n=1 Tax=unclassified Castellaniella TaxID=2617606 RepID=UPI00331577D1